MQTHNIENQVIQPTEQLTYQISTECPEFVFIHFVIPGLHTLHFDSHFAFRPSTYCRESNRV